MIELLKKIGISLILTIIILIIFIGVLGKWFSNDDGPLILMTASLQFTLIMCTLFILEKIKK